VFPCATAVTASNTRRGWPILSSEEYLSNLLELLPTLPARLESLTLGDDWSSSTSWGPDGSAQLAAALAGAACASGLELIHMEEPLDPAAVDVLLQHLPSLTSAWFRRSAPAAAQGAAATWRPSPASSRLLDLELACEGGTVLDLAGLGSATQLTWLEAADPKSLANMAALCSLSGLRELALCVSDASSPAEKSCDMSALQGLQQLSSIRMPNSLCTAAGWRVLATLPALESIELEGLVVADTAAVAAVTDLYLGRMQLDVPADRLAGCLVRMMPRLRHANLGHTAEVLQLSTALQGHSAVSSLSVHADEQFAGGDDGDDEGGEDDDFASSNGWCRRPFADLPALTSLNVWERYADPAALVQSVASYSRLSRLVLQDLEHAPAAGGMGPALEALAAGPLSKSLSDLSLFGSGIELLPAEVAALLKGSMQCARIHLCSVHVAHQAATAQEYQEQLQELGVSVQFAGFQVSAVYESRQISDGWQATLELGMKASSDS
jgi:hypothetical protein